MKITVTKTQMLELLSRALNTEVTDFTVSKSKLATQFEDGMTKQMGQERPFPAHRKLEAIKRIRTLSVEFLKGTMGLADSKWAIENWSRWITFVRTHGRVPIIHNAWTSDPELT